VLDEIATPSSQRNALSSVAAKLLLLVPLRVLGYVEKDGRFASSFEPGDAEFRETYAAVTRSFIGGYESGVLARGARELCADLRQTTSRWRGFAYEGAAMALTQRCQLSWRWSPSLLRDFMAASEPHIWTIHAGIGMAIGALRYRSARVMDECDPSLRQFAFDAWGFHDAFFLWYRKPNAGWPVSYDRTGYEQRVRTQGVGRCIWLAEGGIAAGIVRRIATFASARHSDLWSGVGFAAGYAGGVAADGLNRLREAAEEYWPHLAQGAAFAAKCALMDRSLCPSHELACRILTGLPVGEAARLTDACFLAAAQQSEHPSVSALPQYETWRRLIQAQFRNRAPPRSHAFAATFAR
jgi:hypothetical protein